MTWLAWSAWLTLIAPVDQIDFDTQIVPILTKTGCNAAACHGAAAGRGGFKLSLFGDDPAADHRAIVRALEGRRLNLVHPDRSLLLQKATYQIDHEGGERFEPGSRYALQLTQWIQQGAPRSAQRKLIDLNVTPSGYDARQAPTTFRPQVVARFNDQTQHDVSDLAVLQSNDPASVEISPDGQVTVRRPGRHFVTVRFLSQIRVVPITIPLGREPLDPSGHVRHNWIDDEVLKQLAQLRLAPAGQADDATLLRRVSLDLTGRLPKPDQVDQFQADQTPDKYERMVDRLLASPEFTEFWTYRLAELLRVQSPPKEPQVASAFHQWIRSRVESDAPWNETVHQLLTAEGDSHAVGPAGFYRITRDARLQAEYVGEQLLGIRIRCANCHNHPLDRWTQDDYHGLAAIFAQVSRGRHVRHLPSGDVIHPRTGQAARARIPGQQWVNPQADPRIELSAWLVDPSNEFLARSLVNRLWRFMMGRGLVEPVDDLRVSNPPSHPQLLQRLTDELIANDFRIRPTLRLIALSAAYRRSSHVTEQNQGGTQSYARALSKPLAAEVLADAVSDVLGASPQYGNLPIGTRAISLVDPRTPATSLDILGRCDRQSGCESSGSAASTGGLPKKLHLMNGPLLNERIAHPDGRLHRLVKSSASDEAILREFYLRALARHPRDDELTYWNEQLRQNSTPQIRTQVLEDVVWSLLSCQEFVTNH